LVICNSNDLLSFFDEKLDFFDEIHTYETIQRLNLINIALDIADIYSERSMNGSLRSLF